MIVKLIIGCCLLTSLVFTYGPKCPNENRHAVNYSSFQLADTIKRNDYIVYNVIKDSLIAGMNISVQNQNIAGKYIVQYFNLDRNTVIANYYPEMLGNIKIRKNGKLWFDQSFLKKDLPESPLDRYKSKAVIKELTIWEYIPEEKVVVFKVVAHVPNTDFVYDFHIRVLPNGKYTIRHIGEAAD